LDDVRARLFILIVDQALGDPLGVIRVRERGGASKQGRQNGER